MSHKILFRSLFIMIVIFLFGAVFFYFSNIWPTQNNDVVPTASPTVTETSPADQKNALETDRLKETTDKIAELENTVDKQQSLIDDLSNKMDFSATKSAEVSGKTILATASSQSATFSTTSSSPAPMGVFTNIKCTKKCVLWIVFSTISKNNEANNVNSYSVYLNGSLQSLSSETTLPISNSPTSVALNGSLSLNAGTYTIEVKTSTSGSTATSTSSSLAVLAIED